jgi:short-subunit dehydrogenase
LKRIAIIGATSAMAEHCARQWGAEPVEINLVGRDASRLERTRQDLSVRCPKATFRVFASDLIEVESIEALMAQLHEEGPIDLALIAHGSLPDQACCQESLTISQAALSVNGLSPVLFAEGFAQHMTRCGSGSIVIIGSVAGDRGRRSNYVYGAAKGLVSRYAQGLQHRVAGTDVHVILVKPGPTDTPMTAKLKDGGAKLAPVESVAGDIVRAAAAGRSMTLYTPGKWRAIMLIIRLMPSWIFNKLNI